MKKLLTLIFGLIFSYSSFGQLSHSFSIDAAPLISYRFLNSKNNGNIKKQYNGLYDAAKMKIGLDSNEHPIFGYAFDLFYNIEMKKIAFSIGIAYCRIGEIDKRKLVKGHKSIIDGSIVMSYEGVEEYKFKYEYIYIGIPLKVSYTLFEKSWDLSVFVEGSINYLVNATTTKPTNMDELLSEPILKADFASLNKFLVGAKGGLIMTKKINVQYSLSIQPDFYMQMTPNLSIEKELKQHNYFGGITFGMTRKI